MTLSALILYAGANMSIQYEDSNSPAAFLRLVLIRSHVIVWEATDGEVMLICAI